VQRAVRPPPPPRHPACSSISPPFHVLPPPRHPLSSPILTNHSRHLPFFPLQPPFARAGGAHLMGADLYQNLTKYYAAHLDTLNKVLSFPPSLLLGTDRKDRGIPVAWLTTDIPPPSRARPGFGPPFGSPPAHLLRRRMDALHDGRKLRQPALLIPEPALGQAREGRRSQGGLPDLHRASCRRSYFAVGPCRPPPPGALIFLLLVPPFLLLDCFSFPSVLGVPFAGVRQANPRHAAQFSTPPVRLQLGLVQWRDCFFLQVQKKNRKLAGAVLALIEKQRNGDEIDTGLVKKVVDSFGAFALFVQMRSLARLPRTIHVEPSSSSSSTSRQTSTQNALTRPARFRPGSAIVSLGLDANDTNRQNLDLYKAHFEGPFLEATRAFYKAESEAFVGSHSVSEYLRKAEERLREEEERVEKYLHSETRKAVRPASHSPLSLRKRAASARSSD